MFQALHKLLKLPPLEERKMSQGLLRRVFLPWQFTKRSDDTYIYYLCARTSFFVTGALLFLHWISLVFQIEINLLFFTITLPETYFIEPFARSFSDYISLILLCTVIPFYLLKYFYNINPKKVDVLWWVVKIQLNTKKSRVRMIAWLITLLSTFLIVGLYSYTAILFWMSYQAFNDLHSSFGFLLFNSIFYLILYSGFSLYIVFTLVALYRYIGPYTGQLSSNSIYQGEQK